MFLIKARIARFFPLIWNRSGNKERISPVFEPKAVGQNRASNYANRHIALILAKTIVNDFPDGRLPCRSVPDNNRKTVDVESKNPLLFVFAKKDKRNDFHYGLTPSAA